MDKPSALRVKQLFGWGLFGGAIIYASIGHAAEPTPQMLNLPPLESPQQEGSNAGQETASTVPLYSQKSGGFGATSDPAFQNLLKKSFPLSPDQVKVLRDYFDLAQRASAAPHHVPTPLVSTKSVALSPGSVPPVIRLATGYVSSVLFVDETGAPWPVQAYDLGDPKSFNVQWDQASHLLMIQGMGAYSTGNMAVRLKGLDIPVMLTIVNDQKQVDYRIDFRVQGRGPGAHSMFASDRLPGQASNVLMNLLEGVPPKGARRVNTSGHDVEAWIQGGQLYVRTQLALLSPSWHATLSSADGMHVYELTATPLLLVSRDGQAEQCKVEGL